MAKHFKNIDDTPKTVFLAPCDNCYICTGYEEDSTLTRVFTNYDDAFNYVKACGWPCGIEDAIVKVTVGCL